MVFNRYADRKSTAATKLANMMLEMANIRLTPLYDRAKEENEVTATDWKVIYEITGILKVIAHLGEDGDKAPSEMTTEELLQKIEALKNVKSSDFEEESENYDDEDTDESEDD